MITFNTGQCPGHLHHARFQFNQPMYDLKQSTPCHFLWVNCPWYPGWGNEPFYWVILTDIVLGYILSLSLLYNNEPNVNSLGTGMVMALLIFQHYRFSHLIIRSINIQDLKFAFLINILKSCLRYKDNISFGFGFNNPTILKT